MIKPLKTSQTRVFLIEGRARSDHRPSYESSLKLTGTSQSFGDVTKIEVPDPNNYDKFIEVDRIRGSEERVTTSLVGRYAAEIKSALLRIARAGCSNDVQLHMGNCTDPSDFNAFNKSMILEDVIITGYNTEDLGALGSDERAKIDETAEISAKDMYEVLPLSFSLKAGDIITNEVIDVSIADFASCGDCGDESDGCYRIYALTSAAGGSAGTPSDVVFSLDKGVTWYAHDIDTLSTNDGVAIDKIGDYIVVISADTDSLHYALQSEILPTYDETWTAVATGFVAAGSPRAMSSVGRKAFIVGDQGYIYFTDEPTAGVEVLDAGTVTGNSLYAVHAIDEDNAMAGGDFGMVVYTKNRTGWSTTSTGPSINKVQAVWMQDENNWFVGDDAGGLYYTINSGGAWTAKALPGTTPSEIKSISFSTQSVGVISAVVSSKARVYRTLDGGYSWTISPQGSASIPAADALNTVEACRSDPNFIVGGGLADDASDGVIMVGQA